MKLNITTPDTPLVDPSWSEPAPDPRVLIHVSHDVEDEDEEDLTEQRDVRFTLRVERIDEYEVDLELECYVDDNDFVLDLNEVYERARQAYLDGHAEPAGNVEEVVETQTWDFV